MKIHSTIIMVSLLFILSIFSPTNGPLLAQANTSLVAIPPAINNTTCGTPYLHDYYLATNEDYAAKERSIEEDYLAFLDSGGLAQRQNATTCRYTVPVVVHIVHDPSTPYGFLENLTDFFVQNKIQALNNGFRHTSGQSFNNPYSGADVGVDFCLAQRDPFGNATTGIIYHADSDLTYDYLGSNLKPTFHWNTLEYLNIYVVKDITDASAYTTLAGNHGLANDGVVLEYDVNEASWVHEVGHYLNLRHTFHPYSTPSTCTQNTNCTTQGDRVCDTPPHSVGGCDFTNSCSNDVDDTDIRNPYRPTWMGGMGDQFDLPENYMSYYNFDCRAAFTQGQADRMLSALLGTRASLLESQACVPVTASTEAGIYSLPTPVLCGNNYQPIIAIKNYGSSTITNLTILLELDGITQYNHNWLGNIPPGQITSIGLPEIFLSTGQHCFYANLSNVNGASSDAFAGNNFQCLDFETIAPTTQFPDCADMEAIALPTNWMPVYQNNSINLGITSIGSSCSDGLISARHNSLRYTDLGDQVDFSPNTTYYYKSVDLSSFGTATFTFDVAYYHSSNPAIGNTTLDISVSSDCGFSYTSVYNKSAYNLHTYTGGTVYNNAWNPISCSDWRTETLNLDAFAGNTEVVIRMEIQLPTGNSQYLYLDNMCVDGVAGPVFTGTPVRFKVFLEGAYTGLNAMNSSLYNANLLPGNQPYQQAPWHYYGTEFLNTLPLDAVDWVLVEARDFFHNELDRKAAILLKDGSIMDVSGTDGVVFQNLVDGGQYYYVIRHRNHLDIIGSALLPANNTVPHDFSSAANILNGYTQLKWDNGVYLMRAGDVDGNGVFTQVDFNQYSNQSAGVNSYFAGDINLDGSVTIGDFNLYKQNASVIGVNEIRY